MLKLRQLVPIVVDGLLLYFLVKKVFYRGSKLRGRFTS